MPFKSRKQQKFLFSQKPEVAAKIVRDMKRKGKSKRKKK